MTSTPNTRSRWIRPPTSGRTVRSRSSLAWRSSLTASPQRLVLVGAQLVPQDAGVVLLDVIHHVFLPDVDRVALAHLDPLDGLLARPALRHRVGDLRLPPQQHGLLRLQVPEVGHLAVAGHDLV